MKLIFPFAISLFVAFNALSQQKAEELIDKGYAHYENNEYNEALKFYDLAIAIDSLNPQAFYLRGATKSLLDKNTEAIIDLSKAIALDPEYAEAYYERGYIYFLLNKPELSIENFTKAIMIKQDYGEAYLNRGTLYCMIGKKEEAKIDYKKARDLGLSAPYAACD